MCVVFFFFNDTATTEIYTLSLHDALPISTDVDCLREAFAAAATLALGMWSGCRAGRRRRNDPVAKQKNDRAGAGQPCPNSSAHGPTLPTWAVDQVGSYPGYAGRGADVVQTAAHDPKATLLRPDSRRAALQQRRQSRRRGP